MVQQKFAVIYEKLKKDISEGIYLYGEQLPSERELVETYHSSRETVRKALELLANEFPFSDLISFKEVKEKLNLNHETYVLVNEIIKASDVPLVKEQLGLRNNDLLCHVVRSRSVNGKVKILDEDYFLTSLVPKISNEIARKSIYDYLEKELHLDISYSNKSITFEPFKDFEYQVFGKVHHPYTATVRSTVFLKDTTRFQYNVSKHLATEFKFNEFSRRQNK